MGTYTVHAKHVDHGWQLEIEGVGVTTSHTLARAEDMVRNHLALALDELEATRAAIAIVPELGELGRRVRRLRVELERIEAARSAAARESREVVRALEAEGLSGRDIASVLGVSPQRVSQLRAS